MLIFYLYVFSPRYCFQSSDILLPSSEPKKHNIEKEHDALEKYYNDVKVATEQVYDNNYVTTQRIKIINSTVPKDLVFTQISIDNKTLTIQALSKTRSAISDLQYNLNNLGFIENTYISGIGERNAQGDYSFSISCTLKEVGNNEN